MSGFLIDRPSRVCISSPLMSSSVTGAWATAVWLSAVPASIGGDEVVPALVAEVEPVGVLRAF